MLMDSTLAQASTLPRNFVDPHKYKSNQARDTSPTTYGLPPLSMWGYVSTSFVHHVKSFWIYYVWAQQTCQS